MKQEMELLPSAAIKPVAWEFGSFFSPGTNILTTYSHYLKRKVKESEKHKEEIKNQLKSQHS